MSRHLAWRETAAGVDFTEVLKSVLCGETAADTGEGAGRLGEGGFFAAVDFAVKWRQAAIEAET